MQKLTPEFIAAAVAEYLAKGGRIQVIPQGRRAL